MPLINKIQNQVSGLKEKLTEIISDSLKENEDSIIKLNQNQLLLGKRADGSDNLPYSRDTITRRIKKGNPVKNNLITLYEYGDFHKSMLLKIDNKKFSIIATDSKTESILKNDYGKKVLGLTKDSFSILFKEIRPKVKKKTILYLKGL